MRLASRPLPMWQYPLRAVRGVAVMFLGLFLATWPLLALFVLLKLML
jgi:hypothetical protein